MAASGFLVAFAFGLRNRGELLSVSYLLGSGLVTIVFFLLHWLLSLSLDSFNFISSNIAVMAFSMLIIMISKQTVDLKIFLTSSNFQLFRKNLLAQSLFNKTIVFIILSLITYSFLENYFWPIVDWDAIAFYDFRARIMAQNGDMSEGLRLNYFFQYPPYTSLLHVFGYVFQVTRVKVAYTFIFGSFIGAFYYLLRRVQNKSASLLTTLLLASNALIFEHAVTAYTNLPYTAFFSLGIIYLLHYTNKKNATDMIIGSILIMLSVWVRSTEPFWIAALALLWFSGYKNYFELIGKILITFLISYPNKIWRLFITQLSLKENIPTIDSQTHTLNAISDFMKANHGILDLSTRGFEVTYFLIATLAPVFFFITVLFLISNNINWSKKYDLLTLGILSGIVWGGTYIFSYTFETWDLIGNSVLRMCMIFIPLLLFVIVRDFSYEEKK